MNPTVARDSIDKLNASEWRKASAIASEIPDAWFRCQALSKAALLTPNSSDQLQLIHQALGSGAACSDPNRIVKVSSFAVKACYMLGHRDAGDKAAIDLLETILTEPSPVRRADALDYLLGAVVGGSAGIFWRVFNEFASACTCKLKSGKRNKRGERRLASWAGPIFQLDHVRGELLLSAIEGPVHREQAIQSRERAQDKPINELVWWPYIKMAVR